MKPQYPLALMLLLFGGALHSSAQQPTDAQHIASMAADYVKNLKSDRPAIEDISLLGAKWYRIKLALAKQDPTVYGLLIMNTDGRLLQIDEAHKIVAGKPDDVLQVIADIAGPAKADADYARAAALYVKLVRSEETLILSQLKDIPGYEKKPLPTDLAGIIRAGWSQAIGKNVRYTFYTYQQRGGVVERWELTFENNQLVTGEANRIYNGVGDAMFYE